MAPFSDEDSPVYLSPGFDANSLTVSALRGIFLEHNINHRPSAKKAELVDIFNQQLAPRARKIVRDRKRIRRTSMGIVDMSSSQEGSTVNGEDDEDESTMSLPPQRRQMPARASRRSTRGAVEKTVIEDPTPLKVSDRRKSTKHSRAESELTGDGDDDRTPRRKTRHIEEAPTVKVEDADTTPVGAPAADSPFTQDNPFQSGSSPIVSVEARRKSAAPRTVTRKSTSTSRRRTTAGSTTLVRQDDGVVPPSSSTFISPLVKWRRQKSPEHSTFTLEPAFEPTLEPSEEFTLEAQLEMEQEQHSNGQLEVRTTGKRQKRQSSGIFKSAPAVVLTTILAGYAAWWRQERIAVGYCGVGREPSAITLPEWASVLQPQCEPCPQHAYCYADMEARCESGFVLQSHPLSLGDVIPLAPSCEPDSTKHRKVKLIADKAVEELRERRARWECGDLKDESGKAVDRVEVDESTLKADVSAMRKRMSATEFEDLWKSAIGEILGREEVTSASNGPSSLLASTSLGRLSLGCYIRRSVRLTLVHYRLPLVLLATLTTVALYLRNLFITSRSDTKRVPALVASTLDRLATQAALYAQGMAAEPFVSVSQMRDDVLRSEFNAKRREEIWSRVRRVVESNANVRAGTREGRGGEVGRAWEWVGSIGFEQGGMIGGAEEAKSEEKEMDVRRWDEGRPLY